MRGRRERGRRGPLRPRAGRRSRRCLGRGGEARLRRGILASAVAGAVGLGVLGAATTVRLADARRAEAAWWHLAET